MNINKLKLIEKMLAKKRADKVPKGFKTITEITKIRNTSREATRKLISEIKAKFPDMIVEKKFNIIDSAGRMNCINHYLIK